MAGLGETILNTAKFISGGEGEVQQRALNKQVLAQNQRELSKQRDKDIAGILDGTDLGQFVKAGDPSDPSQPLYTFDVVSAFEKNPEATTQFLNSVPSALLNATDEKGNTINVKVKGIRAIDPAKTGGKEMFAVEVIRPDGKSAPLTRRGTSSPDDNVILMSREDLGGLAAQRLTSMRNNGAFDNASSFLRGMSQLQDAVGEGNARKEQALRDEVTAMIETGGVPVEQAREIFSTFSALEGEDLLTAAEDFGIDIDAVFEEYAANNPETVAATSEGIPDAARDTSGLGNSDSDAEDLTKAVSGLGALIKDPAKTVGDIFGAKAIMGDPNAAPAAAAAKPSGPKTKADYDAAFKAAVEAADAASKTAEVGTRDYSYEGLRQRVEGAVAVDPTQSSVSPELKSAPQGVQDAILSDTLTPEQRKEAILGALESGLTVPNEKQAAYVRDYMISKGYRTPESLASAPAPEVMNIAFTLAANADVANSADRLKIAQSLMNFAQFGNVDTNAEDMAKLQIDAARLQQDKLEFGYKVGSDAAASETKDFERNDAAYKAAATSGDTLRAAIPRNDRGQITGPMAVEGWNALDQILTRAQRFAKTDPVQAQAYMDVAGEVLPDALAAYALHEPRADLAEWVTGGFQDFFNRAKYRELNAGGHSFRLTYDNNGDPKFLYLVTPKGDDAEGGQINMQQLQARFGRDGRDLILDMIKKTGELKNDKK